MSDVVLSRGIRSNLLSLQNASGLQEIAQNRLATGRKVNNALDDPLNFFQSQNLSTSAKDLGRLLDNMGLGLETLKKTDATLVSMTRLIEQMQAGLRTALTSASTVSRLASGMNPTTTRAIDYITNPNIVGTSAPGSPGAFPATATMTINFSVPSSPTIAHAAAGPPAGGFTVAFTNPMTAQQLRDAINANAANNNTTTGERYVNAVIDAGGRLTIENTTSGSLQIVMGGAGLPANPLGALFGTFEPPLPTSTTSDTGVITATTNPTRAKFAEQYNDMLTQITNFAKDAGYNGANLLYGQTLELIFNSEATTRLIVRGVVFDSPGLGFSTTDTRRNMQSDTEINAGLGKLDAAMKMIRAQQATFAANNTVAMTRKEFTEEAIKTLKDGADGLVVADMNEESASLLALNTRQQLSMQALSLASQADQVVLRLFG